MCGENDKFTPSPNETQVSCLPNIPDYKKIKKKRNIGRNGDLTSRIANGARCVKITVPTERLGKM
jgi:hypothetical protein